MPWKTIFKSNNQWTKGKKKKCFHKWIPNIQYLLYVYWFRIVGVEFLLKTNEASPLKLII